MVKLEKEDEVTQDTFGFPEERKKDKKTKKQNIGGEGLMVVIKEEQISEDEEERINTSQDLFAESLNNKKKNKKAK